MITIKTSNTHEVSIKYIIILDKTRLGIFILYSVKCGKGLTISKYQVKGHLADSLKGVFHEF